MNAIDPKLVEIAERIIDLKKSQLSTGVKTTRSQAAVVKDLDPVQLSLVLHLVNKALEVPNANRR